MSSTQGRNNPHPEVTRHETVGVPPRRRRKTLRHHFCDGIEAAVKAEPQAFKATKPRTMMGLMVREIVCAAASARCDAIKLVMGFLDEVEVRRTAADIAAADNSQGNSEPESPPEPRWDWSEDGAWDSSERESEHPDQEEKTPKAEAASEAQLKEMRAELRTALLRAAEADFLNKERKARLAAERDGTNPPPAPPNSGNIPPAATPDHAAGTIRVGGRLVEG